MTTSEQVLVIILSVFLAIFLLLAIFALVKFLQILKHIQRITEKAEQIADKAEAVSEFFSRTARPAAVATLLGNIIRSFKEKGSKGGRKDEERD